MTPRSFYALLGGAAVLGAGALWMLARPAAPQAAALTIDSTGVVTYSVGSPDAPIVVWEGSDYQCPDCSRYEAEEMPAITERFIATGRVRWRYLLFALPEHAEAGPATEAMACALDQGAAAAGAMHRGLFAHRPRWAKSPDHLAVFRAVADSGGLDLAEYDDCMARHRHAAEVARSWREAQRVGIPGTPTVVLFDRFYVGGLTANQLERVLAEPPERR